MERGIPVADREASTAFAMVRNGCCIVPGLESDPWTGSAYHEGDDGAEAEDDVESEDEAEAEDGVEAEDEAEAEDEDDVEARESVTLQLYVPNCGLPFSASAICCNEVAVISG